MRTAIEEKALLHFAQELAINHHNISLLNAGDAAFEKIFDTKKIKHHGISRNIMIIGAGASTNSHDIFKVTNEILTELYFSQLQFDKVLDKETVWKKFIEEAGKLMNHRYPHDTKLMRHTISTIARNLSFEDNLKLLSLFTTNETLSKKLKYSLVNLQNKDDIKVTDYIPSLLYELLAFLFKHRFIDVIINMNFDEMLDNAIEDEMGDSTYYKIIQDSDIISLKEIVDEDYLRIPVYIKPHGTFRSVSSMKYTVDRYISQPTAMDDLLRDIFSGSVRNPQRSDIKYLNVIFVGYSFKDIDMQSIIFEQIVERYKREKTEEKTLGRHDANDFSKMNFFIFARDKSRNINNFKNSLQNWVDRQFPSRTQLESYDEEIRDEEYVEYYTHLCDDIEPQLHFIKCSPPDDTQPVKPGSQINEDKDEYSFAYAFMEVYEDQGTVYCQ